MSEYTSVSSSYLLQPVLLQRVIHVIHCIRALGSGDKWSHKTAQTRFIKPHTPEWSASYLEAGETPFSSLLKVF